jgi:hypothetical protein
MFNELNLELFKANKTHFALIHHLDNKASIDLNLQ